MNTNQAPESASESIKGRLESISGKPLLVQRDPNCSGQASIKIASDEDSAHVLLYKSELESELESELPYLSAFNEGALTK